MWILWTTLSICLTVLLYVELAAKDKDARAHRVRVDKLEDQNERLRRSHDAIERELTYIYDQYDKDMDERYVELVNCLELLPDPDNINAPPTRVFHAYRGWNDAIPFSRLMRDDLSDLHTIVQHRFDRVEWHRFAHHHRMAWSFKGWLFIKEQDITELGYRGRF